MRIDGFELVEGSDAANLTVASGDTYPLTPSTGELFYLTTDTTLYVYDGTTWASTSGGEATGSVTSVDVSGGVTGLTFTGGPIVDAGVITAAGTLAIASGGTGQATAALAINALLPTQTGNIGKFLATDGTAPSWSGIPASSITGTIPETQIADGALLARVAAAETITAAWSHTVPLTIPVAPSAPGHAASKDYVDTLIQGLSWKQAARAATTANIPLAGFQTVDTVALVAGDRLLAKNQTVSTENGIYVVASSGWARADDFGTAAEVNGAAVFVREGTQQSTAWVQTSKVVTVGGTPITFAIFSATGGAVAKTGDTMTGPLTLPLNGLRAGADQLVLLHGNIGMGTVPEAGPTRLLVSGNFASDGEIRTDIGVDGGVAFVTTGGDSNFQIEHAATGTPYLTIRNSSGAGANMIFAGGTTESLRITDEGIVNIGIPAGAGALLNVAGAIRSSKQGIRGDLAFKIDNTQGALAWAQPNILGHFYNGLQDGVSLRVPSSIAVDSGSYDILQDGSHHWYGAGGTDGVSSLGPKILSINPAGALIYTCPRSAVVALNGPDTAGDAITYLTMTTAAATTLELAVTHPGHIAAPNEAFLNTTNGAAIGIRTGSIERMRFYADGTVVVGLGPVLNAQSGCLNIQSTGFPLALRCGSAPAGAFWITGPEQNSNYVVYNEAGTGMFLQSGTTAWQATSDERLKTDLKPIEDAVNKVGSLRAVTGRFKTDDEGRSRAFLIAQDVQKVLPEAVVDAPDGHLGLAYTDVIPLLVAAIKELKATNEELNTRVTEAELLNVRFALILEKVTTKLDTL